jgi:hypothetical protein
VLNNIFSAGEVQIGNAGGGPQNCAYQPELQGPGGIWKSCFQNSSFSHNLIIGGSDWPKENLTPKDMRAAGVREIHETGAAPYQLCRGKDDSTSCKKASPALGAATDGRDIGADVPAIHKLINQAISGVS